MTIPNLLQQPLIFWGMKGYAVEAVKTGHEAIAKTKQRRYDVTLLDLNIRDTEGLHTSIALPQYSQSPYPIPLRTIEFQHSPAIRTVLRNIFTLEQKDE